MTYTAPYGIARGLQLITYSWRNSWLLL